MKHKALLAVVAVAAVAVGGAYVALSRGSGAGAPQAGGPFLPEIAAKSAAIARIEIERGAGRIELVKEGDAWKLASSDGYPARFEEAKAIVSGLSTLKIDQKMTARKERHADLALAWPEAAGDANTAGSSSAAGGPSAAGRAARVRLYEAGTSEPFVDVILGEERANPRAQFVRKTADDQTWRVLGSVLADIEARRWVEAELATLPENEVTAVRWNGLEIKGTAAEDGKMSYAADAPSAPTAFEWTDARRLAAVRTMPSWLSRLELDGVRKAKGGEPDPALSPEFEMVRGTLKVRGVREGAEVWISLEATPKDGAPSAAEINAKKKFPGDPFVPDWKDFAAKHAGWEYRLPSWKTTPLDEPATIPVAAPEGEPDPTAPTQLPSAGG
ncbi:MAG: DUF4340 domain-containing protein [Planctomycetaceae bacterium]|nr:DUF4340 domain-containing protein [Planctomycetaceae bacterium]